MGFFALEALLVIVVGCYAIPLLAAIYNGTSGKAIAMKLTNIYSIQ